MRQSLLGTGLAAALVGVAAMLCGCNAVGDIVSAAPQTQTVTPADHHTPMTPEVGALLSRVQVVNDLTTISGYERSCRSGKKCVFGQAWTDDSGAPLAHNGCDTRSDILRTQLSQVRIAAGTHNCKVVGGALTPDPYTGTNVTLTTHRSTSSIEIDHIFPLKRAWDSGAAHWTQQQRTTFANDPRELLAVDGPKNSGKGSKGPENWLPPNMSYRCTYIQRYLSIAADYKLPITAKDKAVAIKTCPQ